MFAGPAAVVVMFGGSEMERFFVGVFIVSMSPRGGAGAIASIVRGWLVIVDKFAQVVANSASATLPHGILVSLEIPPRRLFPLLEDKVWLFRPSCAWQ